MRFISSNIATLLDPKSKRFWLMVIGSLVVVGILLLSTIFVFNGASFFQSDRLIVTIDSPSNGRTIYEHTSFEVSGRIFGGPVKRVYVWDAAYNVGRLCGVYDGRYSVELNSDSFSTGEHTLCVQAVGENCVSNVAQVVINVRHPTYSTYTRTGYISDSFPQPFGFILRPVETAVRDVIVKVSGGTAPDDLNGDNIPDSLEMSPIAPTYNPTNIPLTFTLIVISLFVVIIVVAFYIKQLVSKQVSSKTEYMKYVASHPTAQRYELNKLKTQLAIAKANKQTSEIKRIEKRIASIEKKMKQPVRIYLGSNQRIKKIKEEK